MTREAATAQGSPVAKGAVADDRLECVQALVAGIADPEIPVVTLADLGILRSVEAIDGVVVVTLTPTW